MDMTIVSMDSFDAAFATGSGDPSTEIPSVLTRLAEEFSKAGHMTAIAGAPLAVYEMDGRLPDPTVANWCVAIPHTQGLEVAPPLSTMRIAGGRFRRVVHVGSYDTLYQTYDAAWKRLSEEGAGLPRRVLERYIDDPTEVPENELQTELLFEIGE
jgi:effector-binding domain-containing protein